MAQTLTDKEVQEYFDLGKQIKNLEDRRKKLGAAMKTIYQNKPGAYERGNYVIKLVQQDRSKMDTDLEVRFVQNAMEEYAQKIIEDLPEELREDPILIQNAKEEAEGIFGPAIKTVLVPEESVIENLVFTGVIVPAELSDACLIENKIMTVRVDPVKAE